MHTLRSPLLWMAILLLGLILVSAALAADSPQTIIRHVEGSAGQKVAAGPFILAGTLGEPIAGPFVTAGEIRAASGFWRGIPQHTRIFLPIVVK